MKLNNISLPYPVLGISDDITPLLPEDSVNVVVDADLKNYVFDISLKFINQDIQALINNDMAEFSCEYECSKTMLRRCEHHSNSSFSISIPRNFVNGTLVFNCFVSVKKTLKNYSNTGFNEDYKGVSFDMEPGDILIIFPHFRYDADIKYDKLQAAGSFMQIRESPHHKEVFFDIATNKIEILLPTDLYQLYNNPIVKSSIEIIHSSLVLNALTYALININDHSETTWAKTILYRIKNEDEFAETDINDSSKIPALAQKLLKNPYSRLFNHLIIKQNNMED